MSGDSDSNDSGIGVHERLRRWRALDDLRALRMRVHRACRAAEEILYHPETSAAERLKAIHAVVAAAREHAKLIEKSELEERVERLEETLNQQRNGVHA